MTEFNITEAATVQFPMVRHAAEIGWTPIAPTDATRKRGSVSGLMFRDELEVALRKFNAWMTDDAIRSVIERLDASPATIEGNRQVLAWLRGERQWFDDEANRYRRVNLIDYETPSNNSFHVTWEWTLRPMARKGNRADVMFLINGIPVAISRAQESQRCRCNRAWRYPAATLRDRNAGTDGNGADLQRNASLRLLVRRNLEHLASLHGALEGTPGR